MNNLNLIGSYGRWAAGFVGDKPGPLSFLNSKWSSMEELRPRAREKIFELVSMPAIDKQLEVKINKKYEYDGLEIEELRWQLPYGPETEAVFMKQSGSARSGCEKKLPGILALHDHGGVKYFGKRKIIRTSVKTHPFILEHQNEYYGDVAWANEIAKRGYGVLVHDVFPFESRKIIASELPAHVVRRIMTPPLHVQEVKPDDLNEMGVLNDYDVPPDELVDATQSYNSFGEQHEGIIAKSLFSSGLTWPGVFIAEDGFALGYLSSRPDIDENRLGCCGLSGGGLRTNYLAGLDERIKCSVTAGFMTTWHDFVLNVNYTHTWMVYIPLLPKFMDFPEVLALRAPLPSMVLATSEDPLFSLEEVERAAEKIEKIYHKAGAPDAVRISYYDGPHKFDNPMQEEAFGWFDRWLK